MHRFVLLSAAIGILGGLAFAGPVTYSISTTATGTLNGTVFTNAAMTVTLTGDTSKVAFGPPPFSTILINPGSATVSIAGLGTGAFTDSIEIQSSFDTLVFGSNSVVLIAQLDDPAGDSVSGIALEESPALFGYDLATPVTSLSGTGGAASGPVNTFPTTAGDLIFTIPPTAPGQPGDLGPSSFTATVVPEPTEMMPLGAGLLGLISLRIRRTRA